MGVSLETRSVTCSTDYHPRAKVTPRDTAYEEERKEKKKERKKKEALCNPMPESI